MNSSCQHVPLCVLGLVAFIIISFYGVDASLSLALACSPLSGISGSCSPILEPDWPTPNKTMELYMHAPSLKLRVVALPRLFIILLVWLWGRAESPRACWRWQPFADRSGGVDVSNLNSMIERKNEQISFSQDQRAGEFMFTLNLASLIGCKGSTHRMRFQRCAKIWMRES